MFEVLVKDYLYYSLIDELRELAQTGVENGGLLLGKFNGKKLLVRKYYLDREAKKSPAHITFSENVFQRARETAYQFGLEIIGTFHTHPSGYMSFSPEDFLNLFYDKTWLLGGHLRRFIRSVGFVGINSPCVHLIFDMKDPKIFKAYTMNPPIEFVLEEVQVKKDGIDALNFVRRTGEYAGFLVESEGELKLESYLIEEVSNVKGLWLFFEDLDIRNLDNFFLKIYLYNYVFRLRDRYGKSPAYFFLRLINPAETREYLVRVKKLGSIHPKIYVEIAPKIDHSKVRVTGPGNTGAVLDLNWRLSLRDVINYLNLPAQTIFYLDTDFLPEELKHKAACQDRRVVFSNDLPLYKILESYQVEYIRWDSPSKDVLRVLRLHRPTLSGYEITRYKDKRVLIAGAGLLGTQLAYSLAEFGVDNLLVVDNGYVDWTDVLRQLYSYNMVGMKKVEAIKSILDEYGVSVEPVFLTVPSLSYTAVATDDLKKLSKYIEAADLVIATLDSLSSRLVLQYLAMRLGKPFISLSIGGSRGEVFINLKRDEMCFGCTLEVDTIKYFDRGVCTLSKGGVEKIVVGLGLEAALSILSEGEPTWRKAVIFHDKDGKINIDYFPASNPKSDCPLHAMKSTHELIKWMQSIRETV